MVRAVSDLLSPLFCCSLSLFYNISRFLSSLFVTGLTGRDRLQHDTMENIENVALKVLVCFFLRVKKSRIRKKNEQTHTTDISTQAKRTSANERLKDGERERSRVRHRKEAGVVSNEKKKSLSLLLSMSACIEMRTNYEMLIFLGRVFCFIF